MRRAAAILLMGIATMSACGGDDDSAATAGMDREVTTTTVSTAPTTTMAEATPGTTLPDPCSLLTDEEVAAATGVSPIEHEPRYGGCYWRGTTTSDMVHVGVSANKIFLPDDATSHPWVR